MVTNKNEPPYEPRWIIQYTNKKLQLSIQYKQNSNLGNPSPYDPRHNNLLKPKIKPTLASLTVLLWPGTNQLFLPSKTRFLPTPPFFLQHGSL